MFFEMKTWIITRINNLVFILVIHLFVYGRKNDL